MLLELRPSFVTDIFPLSLSLIFYSLLSTQSRKSVKTSTTLLSLSPISSKIGQSDLNSGIPTKMSVLSYLPVPQISI